MRLRFFFMVVYAIKLILTEEFLGVRSASNRSLVT